MGKFSSDRAIQDYAQKYWNLESTRVEYSREGEENKKVN
jgi:glycogen phosphorylase